MIFLGQTSKIIILTLGPHFQKIVAANTHPYFKRFCKKVVPIFTPHRMSINFVTVKFGARQPQSDFRFSSDFYKRTCGNSDYDYD